MSKRLHALGKYLPRTVYIQTVHLIFSYVNCQAVLQPGLICYLRYEEARKNCQQVKIPKTRCMKHIDETTMLTALKNGDLKAYRYFFMKYYRPLCLKARMMLNSMEEAEQLVQQLFVEVWEQQKYLEIEESVGGYFYRLVHNSCLNLIRQRPSGHPSATDHGLLLMQATTLPAAANGRWHRPLQIAIGWPDAFQLLLICLLKRRYREAIQLLEMGVSAMRSNLRELCLHMKG